jgi:hypothetical protein
MRTYYSKLASSQKIILTISVFTFLFSTISEAKNERISEEIAKIAKASCANGGAFSGYDDQPGGRCPIRKYSIAYAVDQTVCNTVRTALNNARNGDNRLYQDGIFMKWVDLTQDETTNNGLRSYVSANLFNNKETWAVIRRRSNNYYYFQSGYVLRKLDDTSQKIVYSSLENLEDASSMQNVNPDYGPERNEFSEFTITEQKIDRNSNITLFPKLDRSIRYLDPWNDPISRNPQNEIEVIQISGQVYILGRSPFTETIYVVRFSPNHKGEDVCYLKANKL